MEMDKTKKAQEEVRIGLKKVDQDAIEGNNIRKRRTRIKL